MSLPLDEDNLIHCRNLFEEETEGVRDERRRGGARGLVFLLTTHQGEISLWPNCVRFVFNLKAVLQYEISPKGAEHTNESHYFRGVQAPLLLRSPFYLFRDKSLTE